VLNNGATSANVDVGFLFNRANGLLGNVAFYWSESQQSIITAFTSSTGITDGNIVPTSFANFKVGTLVANALTFADGTPIATSLNQGLYMGSATATTAVTLIDSVPASGNSMVRWTTTSKDNVNNRFRVGTIDALSDGTEAYYTEYGVIKSNSTYEVTTFTSNIYANAISLWAIGNSSNVSVTFNRIMLGSSTTVGYMNAGPVGLTGPTGTISNTTGLIVTTNTTAATSTTTGALVVAGGVGVAGNVTAANLVITTGITYANGAAFSSGSGSGTAVGNSSIITNNQNITANATLNYGTNGFSVGPVNTANGITVTVTNGQRWVII
jgi:hypothetical protein